MSTTRSLMGSAKVLRLELSTTPGGVPDQTLNFGVGNMIDMRKSRHSGKKIYYFLGKPLGEPIWGTRGDLGDKVVIFWIFLILALMGPPFSPPCPQNGG